MRIAVFGYKGMLGRHVVRELRSRKEIVLTPDINVAVGQQIRDYALEAFPALVINCTGAIPEKSTYLKMLRVNAWAPHAIAMAFACPIIHISTDCVFEGDRRYNYFVDDKPDARTLYGRTKALGEVVAPHVTNIRTSFIGPDHGLLRWLLDSHGREVYGWAGAIWSGSTVQEVARKIADMTEVPPGGIQHLATENPMTKYDLLQYIVKLLHLNVKVQQNELPFIWRGLRPTIIMRSVMELSDDIRDSASWTRGTTPKIRA